MTKVTLNDLANLQNENTAITTINQNNATIETAFDNTLSRDGSTPNQMEADLDMNSNDILNAGEVDVKSLVINNVKIETQDLATLEPIDDGYVFANTYGASHPPSGNSLPTVLDHSMGTGVGSLIVRKSSGWAVLAPGDANTYLMSNGSGAELSYEAASGGGGDFTVVTGRATMRGLSPSDGDVIYLSEAGRSGMWKYTSSDVSSSVSPRTLNCTSVGTTDVITSNGHRFRTGDCFLFMSGDLGLNTNTYYYAIRLSANTFYAATSRANAMAGTPVGVNDSANTVIKVTPDDLEGETVLLTGADKDGSDGAWQRIKPVTGVYDAQHFGLTVGDTTDNAGTIRCIMHTACEIGGGKVLLPTGVIYMVNGILARRNVEVEGTGKHSTYLDWHGATPSYMIDARDDGTDGIYPYDRTLFSFRDMTIDGTNLTPSSAIMGIILQGNYRSPPILERVRMRKTTSRGIYFYGDNWNIEFVDVELDTCATHAGAGIGCEPSVTSLNHINFTRVRVEGCGSSTSNAGGIDLEFTALGPRGFNFTDCQAEGNFGSDECYFSNVTGLNITGFYLECLNVGSVNRAGVEFNNCTGYISGQFYADSGTPKQAIKTDGTTRLVVIQADVGPNWGTATIEANDSSLVKYGFLTATGGSVVLTGSGTISAM